MPDEIQIIKASGERQPFSEEKLRDSLKRSGATEETIENVVDAVRKELREGMTTAEIYRRAYAFLKKGRKDVAARYSLRQAVMALGPTGFPFEKFFGEVIKTQGYEVQTGVILYGYCVTHEVDVFATRGDKHIFMELKFHNTLGIKTDLKDALYVKARFDDLKAVHQRKEVVAPVIHEGWLVTNTKLTSKARQYGRCSGLKLVGWNYPQEGNLQDMIIAARVHPISCLTTLSQGHKRALFERGVVLCRDVVKQEHILREIGLDEKKAKQVMDEISLLCTGGIARE